MKNTDVGIVFKDNAKYPENFNPSSAFPELEKFGESRENDVYEMLRENFKLLGFDKKNYGKGNWNPLKDYIKPGDNVVLKPNAVLDVNKKKGENVFASITHGSVIRAIVDYVFIALEGKGKITIADAPLMHSDFENWLSVTRVLEIKNFYKENFDFGITILDLRETYVPYSSLGYAPHKSRRIKQRDPAGYIEVDMGRDSAFYGLSEDDFKKFYGSDYDRSVTVKNHLKGHHKYKVSKTILDADVVISIPKLKTHKKVGTTLNMKNMVGTQGDKNFIPHYKIGSPNDGGDEYPNQGFVQNCLNKYRSFLINSLLRRQNRFYEMLYVFGNIVRFGGQKIVDFFGNIFYGDDYIGMITGGSWYGNDTAWRMTLDLIKIVLYSDVKGNMKKSPQRKFISVIDGVIAGEGEGPLAPSEKKAGCILVGVDPLAVDLVATRLMGFNPMRINLYKNADKDSLLNKYSSVCDIKVLSNKNFDGNIFSSKNRYLDFIPPKGWRGHIN